MSRSILSVVVAAALSVAALVQAEPFKTQTIVSLGVSGSGVVSHPNRPEAPSIGLGGHLGVQVRPFRLLSIGIGGDYFKFVGAGGPWAASANVMGRLFPFATKGFGEWYLQGGVGLMPSSNQIDPLGRKVHGSAALGYQISGNGSRILDLAAVVNSFSPRNAALSTVGLQVGIGWRFGGKNNVDYAKAKRTDVTTETESQVMTGENVNAETKLPEASTQVQADTVADGGVDGKAALRGKEASLKTKAGALEGGTIEPSTATQRQPEPGVYKVKIGDNLWRIARRDKNLGQGKYWSVIYKANQDKIKDPAVIQPYWDLKIPGADVPQAKPAVNAVPTQVEPEGNTTDATE